MDTARHTAVLLFIFLLILPFPVQSMETAATLPGQELRWYSPDAGMELARLIGTKQENGTISRRFTIRVIRFDTALYDFKLFSSRWDGMPVPTLREWTEREQLSAAINASMFQKDGITSTGYMRRGEQTNNGRIVNSYGSFFVCSPRQSGIPLASVLDRNADDWERLLPLYDVVIQNFRLMGPEGEQLWPENGPTHAIAAIAEDREGRILFLHCSDPISVHDFVEALKAHSGLHLDSAMYVEGGSEASLLINKPEGQELLNGMSPASIMLSSRGIDIPLPNILGAVRR